MRTRLLQRIPTPMKVVIYHTSHTGTGLFVANKVKEQLQKTGEYSSIDIKNINKIMQ